LGSSESCLCGVRAVWVLRPFLRGQATQAISVGRYARGDCDVDVGDASQAQVQYRAVLPSA
jgi:hypothetical protein